MTIRILSDTEFRTLMAEWGTYVYRGNKHRLGIVQSQYREYIPAGAYGASSPIDDIKPDVLEWDQFWTTRPSLLRQGTREVIELEYLTSKHVRELIIGKQIKSGQWRHRKDAAIEASSTAFHGYLLRKRQAEVIIGEAAGQK